MLVKKLITCGQKLLVGLCLLLLAPRMGYAKAPMCSDLFSTEFLHQGLTQTTRSEKQKAQQIQIDATYKRLQKITGSLLFPENYEIVVSGHQLDSHINYTSQTIKIGLRKGIHPRRHEIDFAHEYGHAIFHENLMRDSELYRTLKNTISDLHERRYQLELTIKDLERQMKSTDSPSEMRKLDIEGQYKMAQYEGLLEKIKSFQRYDHLTKAYHELFADVTSYIVTQNKRAIQDSLLANKETDSGLGIETELRTFDPKNERLKKDLWMKNAGRFLNNSAVNYYYALHPVRWEIGRLTEKQIKSEAYQKELYQKIYVLLKESLEQQLQASPQDLGPSGLKPVGPINRSLIESLQSRL